jgi:hypothetical protein
MANLQASSSGTLSATQISSPINTLNAGSMMMEYAGSTSMANSAAINLIGNTGGYARMIGTVYFMAVRNSTSWSFGMFSFETSRYGTGYTNILQSDWGSYSCANYQDPGNVSINYLQFTNNSGDSGTFYFNVLIENTTSVTGSYLTRIK